MFKGYIYKTTNILTNKVYIGQKWGLPDQRKYYIGSGTRFWRSVKKHGRFYFKKEILGIIEVETESELQNKLNEAEIDCVYHFRAFGSDGEHCDEIYGYNLTKGGEGIRGFHFTKESKLKMSEAQKKIAILGIRKKSGGAGIGNKNRERKDLDLGLIQFLHKQGLTYREIADECGCSFSAIYNRLNNIQNHKRKYKRPGNPGTKRCPMTTKTKMRIGKSNKNHRHSHTLETIQKMVTTKAFNKSIKKCINHFFDSYYFKPTPRLAQPKFDMMYKNLSKLYKNKPRSPETITKIKYTKSLRKPITKCIDQFFDSYYL